MRTIVTARSQRGLGLFGLLLTAIVLGFLAITGMQVIPTVTEYNTIRQSVKRAMASGAGSVGELRTAFDRQMMIETSNAAFKGEDLQITRANDKFVVRFAYTREIEIYAPVFLLMKYEGGSDAR